MNNNPPAHDKLRLVPIDMQQMKQSLLSVIEESDRTPRFLCQYQHKLFVSTIKLLTLDRTSIKPNCHLGWLYVNPPDAMAIGLDQLETIYYIQGGDL